MSIPNPKK